MFNLNKDNHVRKMIAVHELGHAYANLNSSICNKRGSISVHVYTKDGFIGGLCNHTAKHENAWERGISLVAGEVFEYLFLKERGKNMKLPLYDHVRQSGGSDMVKFNSLQKDFPNEAEYIGFVEAVNAAEGLWYSGGREFVKQYLPLMEGKKNVDVVVYDASN